MGSHIVIRQYRATDLGAVLDLWDRASRIAHPFLDDAFLADERRRLAHDWLPKSEVYVAESARRVVGFLALSGDEIGGLFVHPDHQRNGAGTELVDHTRKTHPTLEVEVFEANPIGRSFYDARGFVPIGRRVDDDTGRTVIRLRLEEK